MALIARVSGDSWDWREEDETSDDGPLTSRSPSFVSLEGAARHPESGQMVISEGPDTLAPPSSDASVELHEWRDRDVTLSTRALKLEESAFVVHDERLSRIIEAIVDDAASVGDSLRALSATCARAWRFGDPSELVVMSIGTVARHVYEWSSSVLTRADEHLNGVVIARDEGELGVAEYSSLFVRAIIDPLLVEAIETCEAEDETDVASALGSLRERIIWLNWATRDID
jgi:hypothetical protein